MKKFSVLFVCLGNICRSPAAEAIFISLLEKKGLTNGFIVDSAGTGSWHIGKKADSRMTIAANRRDINILSKARQITSKDFDEFNYILAMDDSNYRNIQDLKNRQASTDFSSIKKIQDQYNNALLEKLAKLKNLCHSSLPLAEKMSADVARFFSPGVIWSKLPKEERSDFLIANQLYTSFKEYLDLYLEILFESKEVNMKLQKELINGQNKYLKYRRDNDPARPMLSSLFGKEFTESLIKEVLFTT